jgi:hypothetical protein
MRNRYTNRPGSRSTCRTWVCSEAERVQLFVSRIGGFLEAAFALKTSQSELECHWVAPSNGRSVRKFSAGSPDFNRRLLPLWGVRESRVPHPSPDLDTPPRHGMSLAWRPGPRPRQTRTHPDAQQE